MELAKLITMSKVYAATCQLPSEALTGIIKRIFEMTVHHDESYCCRIIQIAIMFYTPCLCLAISVHLLSLIFALPVLNEKVTHTVY